MSGLPTACLFFNGLIVMMAGLLVGFPLRSAIANKKEAAVNAWRVAHSVFVMDGLVILMIGITLPHLVLGRLAMWILVWSLIASGYGFVVAFTIGAWKGLRGLTAKPYGLNTLLFGAHVIGASGSLIGVAVAIYGSLKAML